MACGRDLPCDFCGRSLQGLTIHSTPPYRGCLPLSVLPKTEEGVPIPTRGSDPDGSHSSLEPSHIGHWSAYGLANLAANADRLGRQMELGKITWYKTQLSGYQCPWLE